jgi:hypothetical protein
MTQAVKCWLCEHKALNSNPSPTKKQNKTIQNPSLINFSSFGQGLEQYCLVLMLLWLHSSSYFTLVLFSKGGYGTADKISAF